MTSFEHYAALADARDAQQRRYQAAQPDRWGGDTARRFRSDPRRQPDPHLAALCEYLHPDDELLDVGGGAGRESLPLALRCRFVTCADASKGMGAEFEASAAEAGISNTRFVHTPWQESEGLAADVVLCSNVTYFVRDIEPFVRKLEEAARRRVIIGVNSVPPPNTGGDVFEVIRGEPFAPVPGHRALLPALWDLGLLPDVRVLPGMADTTAAGAGGPNQDRTAVVEGALRNTGLDAAAMDQARRALLARFDELWVETPRGYRTRLGASARRMLITWEPRHR